jgi:thiamine-monophosphate kinase
MDELERVARLAALFPRGTPGVEVGIGDDCAVLDAGAGEKLVWTIDEQVEGTHFRRELASFEDIGFRSFMAAASDLAAMGAAPWCALAALALPRALSDDALLAIAAGQRDASAAVGCGIVGGNLARGERLSIATTLLGRAKRPVERRGAKPGDGLWMAGWVGRAAAGLLALGANASRGPAIDAAVEAWRRPVARIADGLRMVAVAHAAIDVSDGLARDLGHVAAASSARAVLDARALEADELLAEAARDLGADALDLALHGGEDYALVVSSAVPIEGFRRIGEITEGEGVALSTAGGTRPIEARGFDHFG